MGKRNTQLILFFTLGPLLKFFLRAQVVGIQNIRPNHTKPLIIAANHQAKVDPYLLLLLPLKLFSKILPVYFPTAEEYCNDRIIGPLIKLTGAYPMKTIGVTIDDFLGETRHYLNEKKTIMIFPEAKLTDKYEKNTSKSGVVYLASKTGAVVVPMHIEGISGISFKDFLMRKRNLKITFGHPIGITVRGNDRFGYKKMADNLLQNIYAL